MKEFQKIEFRKRRDFGEIFNTTFSLLRQNYKMVFKTIIFTSAPVILAGGILSGMAFSSIFRNLRNTPPDTTFPVSLFAGYILLIIGFLIYYSVIYEYVKLYVNSDDPQQITVNDIWQHTMKDIWKILALNILKAIIIFAGFFLLIFPGIYLAVALSFATILMITENQDIISSISRSIELMRGHWLKTFGLLFVIGIIEFFLSYTILIPLYIASFVMSWHNFLGGTSNPEAVTDTFLNFYSILMTIAMPIVYLVDMFIYSITYFAVSLKYFAVVEEKESVKIMERIDQLGTDSSTN